MSVNSVTRTGHVKHWDHRGNYGFISTAVGEDVYFHGAVTVDRGWLPSIGQRVSFQLIRDPDRRLRARDVVHLSAESRL